MFVGLSESVTAPCGAATLTEGARRTRAPARATEEKVLGLVTHHPSCPSLATGEAYLLSPLSESLSPGRASRNCRTGFLFATKATLRPWPVEMASPLPKEPKQLAMTQFPYFHPFPFFSPNTYTWLRKRTRVEIHASGGKGPLADTPLIADAGTPFPGLPSTKCTWQAATLAAAPPKTPSFPPFLAGSRL